MATFLPADRDYAWNPGRTSVGGVPVRNTIFTTINPTNTAADIVNINNALNACPPGQVVKLAAGTFLVNDNPVFMTKTGLTLRGAGPGVTIQKKTNGSFPRTTTPIPNTSNPVLMAPDGRQLSNQAPVVFIGPGQFGGPDVSGSKNLTVDGAQGATTVTVADTTGLTAGTFVLLDELTGGAWVQAPKGASGTLNDTTSKVWAGDRIAWNMHLPQRGGDDCANSNAGGPYDSTPGVLPAAMSNWCRLDRPVCEIKEIASLTGTTITFTSPLTISYRVSRSAQ